MGVGSLHHLSASSTTRRIAIGPGPSKRHHVIGDTPVECRRAYSTTTTTTTAAGKKKEKEREDKKKRDEAFFGNADVALGELEKRFGGRMTWSHKELVELGYSEFVYFSYFTVSRSGLRVGGWEGRKVRVGKE